MSHMRPMISLLLFSALALATYAFVYGPVQRKQADLRSEISLLMIDIDALNARIAGLGGARSDQHFPKELIWFAKTKTDAELMLQDVIVDLVGQLDMTLMTFGPSVLTRETEQPTIAFELETETTLGKVHLFLAQLEQLDPKVAVGMLRIRPAQSYSTDVYDDVRVYAQFTVWAFWDEPS